MDSKERGIHGGTVTILPHFPQRCSKGISRGGILSVDGNALSIVSFGN